LKNFQKCTKSHEELAWSFLSYLIFHVYFTLTIYTASKLWLGWTIDDNTILRTLWTFFYAFVDRNIWTNT
jgi:hypothetical protein